MLICIILFFGSSLVRHSAVQTSRSRLSQLCLVKMAGESPKKSFGEKAYRHEARSVDDRELLDLREEEMTSRTLKLSWRQRWPRGTGTEPPPPVWRNQPRRPDGTYRKRGGKNKEKHDLKFQDKWKKHYGTAYKSKSDRPDSVLEHWKPTEYPTADEEVFGVDDDIGTGDNMGTSSSSKADTGTGDNMGTASSSASSSSGLRRSGATEDFSTMMWQ